MLAPEKLRTFRLMGVNIHQDANAAIFRSNDVIVNVAAKIKGIEPLIQERPKWWQIKKVKKLVTEFGKITESITDSEVEAIEGATNLLAGTSRYGLIIVVVGIIKRAKEILIIDGKLVFPKWHEFGTWLELLDLVITLYDEILKAQHQGG